MKIKTLFKIWFFTIMKIKDNTKEYKIGENGKISLSVYPINELKVLTLMGSFKGGKIHSIDKNPLLPEILSSMLKTGTRKSAKLEIAERLESLGSAIHFDTSAKFTKFEIKSRKENFEKTLKIFKEILFEPAFPKKELSILKKNLISSIKEEKEDTRDAALNSLKRSIFKKGHPNYAYSTKERINFVKKITVKDLKKFHKKHFIFSEVNLVIAGSAPKNIKESMLQTFSKTKVEKDEKNAQEKNLSIKTSPRTNFIEIPEKDNADVFFGKALPFSRKNPEYFSILLASSILGGGFTGRLIKNVREKKGLTYGTTARLKGFEDEYNGFWFAFGMFSHTLLNDGVKAMREELQKFYKKGVSMEEIKNHKTQIIGLHKIALSDTSSIASRILNMKERGLPIEYIDDFEKRVNNVSKKDIENVIKKYFNPEEFSLSIAGTIPKNLKITKV